MHRGVADGQWRDGALVGQREILIYFGQLNGSTLTLKDAWEIAQWGARGLWPPKLGYEVESIEAGLTEVVLDSDEVPKLRGKEELTLGGDGLR